MPDSDADALDANERLRLQNELTRADLEDQAGAWFGEVDGEAMDPAMEAEWLQRIKSMEAGGKESYVPIRSLVSRKALKQAAAQFKKSPEDACVTLTTALQQAGVFTDMPEWLPIRAFYHFLTNDLLDHTIPRPLPASERMTADGKAHMVGVLYDQVRQDSPEYLMQVTEQFLLDVLTLEEPFTGATLAAECRQGTQLAPKQAVIERINAWRAQFASIVPVRFVPRGPYVAPDKALYNTFDCAYDVTFADGREERLEGDGLVQVLVVDKHFEIVGCSMPGFEL